VRIVKVQRKGSLIVTLNSTLPTAVRKLIVREYIFGEQPKPGTGFMRMLRPIQRDGYWEMQAPSEYASYSEEQYDPKFMGTNGVFSMAVKAKLSGTTEFNGLEWKRTLDWLEFFIKARAQSVVDGFNACQQIDCKPGTEGWDAWSSPGRDSTLKGLVSAVSKTVDLNGGNREMLGYWQSSIQKSFNYGGGTLSVEDVVTIFSQGRYDSDPRRTIRERWGL
jgi:hypothetical protein